MEIKFLVSLEFFVANFDPLRVWHSQNSATVIRILLDQEVEIVNNTIVFRLHLKSESSSLRERLRGMHIETRERASYSESARSAHAERKDNGLSISSRYFLAAGQFREGTLDVSRYRVDVQCPRVDKELEQSTSEAYINKFTEKRVIERRAKRMLG
uniref:Uncharacterized protein n=1 Tax=Trichogramma kaykai TaxID=54128 RepID=A0ABD2W0D2_9HYME